MLLECYLLGRSTTVKCDVQMKREERRLSMLYNVVLFVTERPNRIPSAVPATRFACEKSIFVFQRTYLRDVGTDKLRQLAPDT